MLSASSSLIANACCLQCCRLKLKVMISQGAISACLVLGYIQNVLLNLSVLSVSTDTFCY